MSAESTASETCQVGRLTMKHESQVKLRPLIVMKPYLLSKDVCKAVGVKPLDTDWRTYTGEPIGCLVNSVCIASTMTACKKPKYYTY